MSIQSLPYAHLGDALATDYFHVRDQFTDEQWEHFIATRRFVDNEVLPEINQYWEAAELPWPLMRRLPELGLLGEDIEGYGCPGMTPLARGLVNMELHRGDGSLGTFLGVQSGLAMKSIALLGSEEQKQRWLPAMAQLAAIGAFALTEPTHGSDSVALETTARRDGDSWVLNGAKRWIGNGSIADVVVVWARSAEDGQVKGFLVEKDTPGFSATTMEGKGASRAIWQAAMSLDEVRVGDDASAARRRDVQGHRPRPDHHAHNLCLGRPRPCRRGLRRRAYLQQAAPAIRQAAVRLPDRPGTVGEDAR